MKNGAIDVYFFVSGRFPGSRIITFSQPSQILEIQWQDEKTLIAYSCGGSFGV
jgi:hypothetical protein